MSIDIREITDRATWELFVRSFSPNCFLQSWNFGQFHLALGDRPIYLGAYEDSRLVGAGLFVLIRARRGAHYACAAGPLVRDRSGYTAVLRDMVRYLRSLGRADRAAFIRIRPDLLNTTESRAIYQQLGFRPAVMHLHAERTWMLDLLPGEEQLLGQMRKNTRYYVKRGPKDNVSVEQSREEQAVDILYELQADTASRQRFVPFSHHYFKKLFAAFAPDDQVAMFTARFEQRPIASAMINYYGDMAVYHYAASLSQYSKLPGAYLILWEAIREAKRRGCRWFNFWGVVGDEQTSHPWSGLSRFKKGFGGEERWYLHAQDLPLGPAYWFNRLVETLRKWKRGL